VLYLMDAPGVRPALKDMAARLASAGYYVMLPFLFYRGMTCAEFEQSTLDMEARRPLMQAVTNSAVVEDARALLGIADDDRAARAGSVGVVGFCMGGPLAVSIARALPDRVAAAASIHGGRLVTDAPDSPHLGADRLKAELYFAWCDPDPSAPAETMPVMTEALAAAGVRSQIDVITTAQHGFAPPDGPRYDRAASELHWERVHSLLRRNL
jgi:carboxymethylenebutenolidase